MFKNIFTAVHLLFLLAGGVLILILLISDSGGSTLSSLYWSKATVDGTTLVWTLYRLCANNVCTSREIAYPYDPVRNLKGTSHSDLISQLPSTFTKNADQYYYLTRIGYGLFLAALIFIVFNWLVSFFAICSAGGILSGLVLGFTTFGFILDAAATALLSAAHIKGRNAFLDAGFSSKLGGGLLAIAWTSVAVLLISQLLVCCIGGRKRKP